MSGRLAALRLARRNAARNRRRTGFLVALIAVPVAVSVVVAGMFRAGNFTIEESLRSTFGNGDIRVALQNDPRLVTWLDSTLQEVSPRAKWTMIRSVNTDLVSEAPGAESMTDIDPNDPLAGPMRVVAAGRAPRTADELALSPRLAERLRLGLGDSVELDLPGVGLRSFRLVGLVGSAGVYNEALVTVTKDTMDAVAPASEAEETTVIVADRDATAIAEEISSQWAEDRDQFWPKSTVLPKPAELASIPDEVYVYLNQGEVDHLVEVARSDGQSAARDEAFRMIDAAPRPEIRLPYVTVETRATLGQQQRSSLVESAPSVSTGVSALLLLEVAFVAGAAFAAGTRRRLREIGLMGANGASQKHIRLTVLGEGLTVGALGALAGIGLGIVALVAARPIIQRFVDKLLVGVGVAPLDLLGPALVAVIAAMAAAWLPARTASRVPVTTALHGRMPAFPPRRWVVLVGLGLAGLGAVLLVVALASSSKLATVIVVGGGAMAIGGIALLAGPILALLSKGADRVGATGRLVLRDSGRHRTRSAVAVAATLVILLIPVISIAFEATSDAQQRVQGLSLPQNHLLLVGSAAPDGMTGGGGDVTPADIDHLSALLPQASVARFDTIDVPALLGWQIPIEQGDLPGIEAEEAGTTVAVATPELIEALDQPGLADAIATDGIAVLGVKEGTIDVQLAGNRLTVSQFPVPVLPYAMPRILVSTQAAGTLDGTHRTLALFVLGRPMTEVERDAVNERFLVVGGYRDFSLSNAYPIMLGGTLVVVLIVIALVTAVSASEVDQDLGIVVAVGASGSIRRRFLGLLAGYQTLIAALLAIPLGLGLLKVVGIAQGSYFAGPFGIVPTSYVEVPWPAVIALAVVLPLIVAGLTALAVRSAPVTPPRRPA